MFQLTVLLCDQEAPFSEVGVSVAMPLPVKEPDSLSR